MEHYILKVLGKTRLTTRVKNIKTQAVRMITITFKRSTYAGDSVSSSDSEESVRGCETAMQPLLALE